MLIRLAPKIYWPTVPTDFPLGYMLAREGEHQMYVRRRWPGLPGCNYLSRELDGQWEMGCLLPGCERERTSVLSIETLLRLLKEGRIVGKRDAVWELTG